MQLVPDDKIDRSQKRGTASRLKILHIITGLQTGGAETMLTRITMAPESNSDSMVVSLVPGGRLAKHLRDAGIKVIELNLGSLLGFLAGLIALPRAIRDFEPAVVQGWMYHGDLAALFGLVFSGRRRKTCLSWGIRCSSLDFGQYRFQLRLVVKVCALLSAWPDVIVANSFAGLRAHRAIGYRSRREEVVPNGIDLDQYRPDPAERRAVRNELGVAENVVLLAHVGRVDPMKDHDTFFAAMTELPHIQALIIGAGTESLSAPNNVRSLGLRTDMPRLLAAADYIVSSSAFGEGFSNALMEGMACGLPAVATDVGDARLILGTTGKVVPPRDPKALASAIVALTREDRTQHDDRSRRAREHIAENFSLGRVIGRFNALYDTILAARAPR